jgi:hypothetical protein
MSGDKDKIIEDLKIKLNQEEMVKKNEFLVNRELRAKILKLQTQLDTVVNLNEQYLTEMSKLKIIMEDNGLFVED